MTPIEILVWLAGVCASLASIGVVARWVFTASLREALAGDAQMRQQEELRRVERDARVDARFDSIVQALDVQRSAVADIERGAQHMESSNEVTLSALDRRVENIRSANDANTRRIIKLESSVEHIERTLDRIEASVKANGEATQSIHREIVDLIAELKRGE